MDEENSIEIDGGKGDAKLGNLEFLNFRRCLF